MIRGDEAIGHRVPWLPDETLFSWCSRYHQLAGNGLASATCMQLFGRRRHGAAHDLPSELDEFVSRSLGSLGDMEALIRDRTLLPFYLPFRGERLCGQAEQSMRAGGIGSLKYRLGLLTSGLGAAHPLKACSRCMLEDRQAFGVAHWRRTHQWPTAWICQKHDEPLLVSPIKLEQRGRFQFALPDAAALVPWLMEGDGTSEQTMARWRKLGTFGDVLCRALPGQFAKESAIASAGGDALDRSGWMLASGRVAWRQFEDELAAYAVDMARLPPFAMQLDQHAIRVQLGRLIAGRSVGQPLRSLVMLGFLFESFEAFQEAYDFAESSIPAEPGLIAPGRSTDQKQSAGHRRHDGAEHAVLELISGAVSATALARRTGVDPSTIAAWAAKAGWETPRRPKILDEARRSLAIELLATGAAKATVASAVGISEVSVTRILRCVAGLQERWHEIRFKAARTKARTAWLEVMGALGALGVSAVRRAEPGAYAWLHRNDREWLRSQSAVAAQVRLRGNHADAKRKRADHRYAGSIRAAINDHRRADVAGMLGVESWAITAPGLRRVLRSPQQWPATIAVLREFLMSTPAPSASLLLD
ncbi:TnsD family Tn7-like transposition protein [Ideonella sp.]|uniref:TnsD family Tn7-like transposition protein n=1 Tax=Ideonella sp. TaxID=1929293 RepID=UPI003BB7F00C